MHIGHQRRFDVGFRRAQEAVASGELGFVHTIRANTHDQAPPPAEFIPTSGGIFRDCGVHDFDAVRFVTGREIASVYAVGANKGADFFAEAGDVDTGAAVLTLDDDTLVLMSTTRYNGGGHDVRMEVMGERGTITAGLDHSLAMVSAEPDVDFPAARSAGPSWSASCRPTGPSSPPSSRWPRAAARAPARSPTRSRPIAPLRRASSRAPSAAPSP